MIRQLPNFITLVRLFGAPPALVAAMADGSREWFAGIYGVALLSDLVDGVLARVLRAQSERGRQLDSLADYLLVVMLAAGLCWLWPDMVRAEWPWIAAGFAAYGALLVYTFARWRIVPGYHTRRAKVVNAVLPFSVALLLFDGPAWPFHLVICLQVAGAAEDFAIARLLPGYRGEVRSYWHARRMTADGWRPPGAATP